MSSNPDRAGLEPKILFKTVSESPALQIFIDSRLPLLQTEQQNEVHVITYFSDQFLTHHQQCYSPPRCLSE